MQARDRQACNLLHTWRERAVLPHLPERIVRVCRPRRDAQQHKVTEVVPPPRPRRPVRHDGGALAPLMSRSSDEDGRAARNLLKYREVSIPYRLPLLCVLYLQAIPNL